MNCPSCDRENSATVFAASTAAFPSFRGRRPHMDSPDQRTMANGGAAAAPARQPSQAAAAALTPPSVTPSGRPPSQARLTAAAPVVREFWIPAKNSVRVSLSSRCSVKAAWAASTKSTTVELDRYAALKVLLPDLAGDPQIIQRFKHELLLASRFSQEFLRIHDLSEADGVKFITMAFVDGEDLHGILKKERPLPLDRGLKFARQMCDALDAAHAKASSIATSNHTPNPRRKNDQVFVSDFGLATSFETAKMA